MPAFKELPVRKEILTRPTALVAVWPSLGKCMWCHKNATKVPQSAQMTEGGSVKRQFGQSGTEMPFNEEILLHCGNRQSY